MPDSSAYLKTLKATLDQIPNDKLSMVVSMLREHRHGFIWICGNGGSQANATHFSIHLQERGFQVVEMSSEPALSSALSNDGSYESFWAKRLKRTGRPGDLLVVFSGSGASVNAIAAVAQARYMDIKTIAFRGFGGGPLRDMVHWNITLDMDAYGPVEDAHSAMLHMVSDLLGEMEHGPALAR